MVWLWCGMVWYVMLWYDYGMVWYSVVLLRNGTVIEWYGMVWYGII